ncbi:MAG: ABC transporter ATP-binding protein/permease [Candidatus Shapirobacteria bacterium]|nr:ABC transporter ATP-binding protein/permease [Candidatus Shapirobacteria bacterium]
MKDYCLKNFDTNSKPNLKVGKLVGRFGEFLKGDKWRLGWAMVAVLINSAANVATPLIVGQAIDKFIFDKNWPELAGFGWTLAGIYMVVAVSNYFQTVLMGRVGQNILYRLRSQVFEKIQSLPLSFFNQNKLGDLISRINSDTDKLNQFFSQSLNQFMGQAFTLLGIGIFVFYTNSKLSFWMMLPVVGLVGVTYVLSSYMSKRSRMSLQSLGNLSAEIQESLSYFKVIVLFNRRDFFRENFKKANENNFAMSIKSGITNNISTPIYDLAWNAGLTLVLVMGIEMIVGGQITVGLLIAFLAYTDKFYAPLRQMAQVWSNTQMAFAGWVRISEILDLKTDLEITETSNNLKTKEDDVLVFDKVKFSYDGEKIILDEVNLDFKKGKTYAMVGPTGGGKSTMAALMCRLYDPDSGQIYFEGKDIRNYTGKELSEQIGFILQEQFIFTGSVGENIVYGNPNYEIYDKKKLKKELKEDGLEELVERFENGLDTEITPDTEVISLGQKQLISFMRAILRRPKLLVMDEATANIDTVTESLLQKIIDKLPVETTKVIIAHRLNTIKKADEIYFVNDGEVVSAESLEKSVEMIEKSKRKS